MCRPVSNEKLQKDVKLVHQTTLTWKKNNRFDGSKPRFLFILMSVVLSEILLSFQKTNSCYYEPQESSIVQDCIVCIMFLTRRYKVSFSITISSPYIFEKQVVLCARWKLTEILQGSGSGTSWHPQRTEVLFFCHPGPVWKKNCRRLLITNYWSDILSSSWIIYCQMSSQLPLMVNIC